MPYDITYQKKKNTKKQEVERKRIQEQEENASTTNP